MRIWSLHEKKLSKSREKALARSDAMGTVSEHEITSVNNDKEIR